MKQTDRKPDTAQINLLATPALVTAIEEKAADGRTNKSNWIRTVLANAVGKPSLAEMPRLRGEPVAKKRTPRNGHRKNGHAGNGHKN